ncbi:MAG: hypothetical protein ACK53L_30660, partial [Pirellulaceae bacterium]
PRAGDQEGSSGSGYSTMETAAGEVGHRKSSSEGGSMGKGWTADEDRQAHNSLIILPANPGSYQTAQPRPRSAKRTPRRSTPSRSPSKLTSPSAIIRPDGTKAPPASRRDLSRA